MRIWRSWKRGKPGREQAKSDRRGGIRLSKLERRAGKQEAEKTKLEHKLEKLLVRGIKAVSPGSYEQRERLSEWAAGVCWVGNWALGDDGLRPSIINAARDFKFKFSVLRSYRSLERCM